jgi:hypothetical protein
MGILDIITGAFLGFSSFSLLLKAKWTDLLGCLNVLLVR